MTPKLATIELIKDIRPHSNADTLSIVKVLGYEAIVKTGSFFKDDLVVFIQPDSVLPDAEWTKVYKSKSSRVKAIKLRGLWSFGVVESLGILPTHPIQMVVWTVGQDVSGLLGITHYEPPIPQDLSAKGDLPFGLGITDEERWQNLEAIPFGKTVDVTLKIDGSSLTVYCKKVDGEWETGLTSRKLDLKLDKINKYTSIVDKFNILHKLKEYCTKNNTNLALRGEMYGSGIQANKVPNPHSVKPLGFAAFSIFNFDTNAYEGTTSPLYYDNVCRELGIYTVPMIEKGVALTPELIHKYDEEITAIQDVPFEGVVIKTDTGESFKVINKSYDSKK